MSFVQMGLLIDREWYGLARRMRRTVDDCGDRRADCRLVCHSVKVQRNSNHTAVLDPGNLIVYAERDARWIIVQVCCACSTVIPDCQSGHAYKRLFGDWSNHRFRPILLRQIDACYRRTFEQF